VTVNGKICHECEREPLSVSGPASIGYDSVLSGESPDRCGDPPNHQIYLIALVHGEVSLYIHTIGWGRDYFTTICHLAMKWRYYTINIIEYQ